MQKLLTILLFLGLLLTVISSAASAQTAISSEAEAHILNELSRARVPNAAIAVIQDGQPSYIFKDSEYDTLFQIGSVSKSFTGFGVLLLGDMGLLSVNDPVNQHLPWFEVRYNGAPVIVTIYDLLHHTSGLTDRQLPVMTGMTTEEYIAQLIDVELASYPSARFAYGNVNYTVLGFIIEAVSGQSYDEFMTQYVLHPLGLYNTFTNTQRAYETGRVIGGNRLGFLRARPWNPPVMPHEIPTGFIYSSITDMGRWVAIHLGTVEVSEQFTRVIESSHVPGRNTIYGAGWNVNSATGEIFHAGGAPGYSAIVQIFQRSNTAVVVLGSLQMTVTIPFAPLVLTAVESEMFNRVSMDTWAIMDIFFTILTAVGIVFIVMFVRLVINLIKRFLHGEVAKVQFTSKNITLPIAPLLLSVGLIAGYIVPPAIYNMPYEMLLVFSPASMTAVGIAMWIIVAYFWCSWLAKVFVTPR